MPFVTRSMNRLQCTLISCLVNGMHAYLREALLLGNTKSSKLSYVIIHKLTIRCG